MVDPIINLQVIVDPKGVEEVKTSHDRFSSNMVYERIETLYCILVQSHDTYYGIKQYLS
jgi:hypothetical protein